MAASILPQTKAILGSCLGDEDFDTRGHDGHLPAVVERLGHLRRLVQMDFWNYWPMREMDDKDLLVSHLEVLPFLR